jgi:hypothetical protein
VSFSPTDAFRAFLLQSTAIAALIDDRLGPHQQPQTAVRPYGVYTRIATDPQHHLVGASGLAFVRIQLDLYGDDFGVLETIAAAVRNRVDGYRGTVTQGSDSLAIQCIELLDQSDAADSPNDGTDSGPHRIRMDFRISAPESIPSFT